MRALLQRDVEVAVPAQVLWDHVTDWERQGEWIPHTRVELVDPADPAHRVGGRIRAWSGLGPLGFWDDMTVTGWECRPDGGGRCEVLHTGAVVRGEGVFEVTAAGHGRSRFHWQEMALLPLGRVGALGWRVVGPVVTGFIGRGLEELRRQVEREHRAGAGPSAASASASA